MKYKVLILIILSLFISGCSVVYKLEIKDDEFRENIDISIKNNDTSSISYFKDNKFYAVMDGASNFIEYNKTISNNDSDSIINLSHNYDRIDYKKATILKSCFDAYNIVSEDKYYLITTSKGIKCAKEEDTVLLDNLTIIIKTNHVVKESNNIESTKDNEYIWKFNKDNYDNAEIYMKIYKNKYVSNYNNEQKIKTIVISILIVILIIFIIVGYIKMKKNQKI